MSEKELINAILTDLKKEEAYLADAVGYVFIKLFPGGVKISKHKTLQIIKEYIKNQKL
jgi:hypothetical protein